MVQKVIDAGGVWWHGVTVQIRLNKLNEKRVKIRVKAHGGTPTLIANMVLAAMFEVEENRALKSASNVCREIADKICSKP